MKKEKRTPFIVYVRMVVILVILAALAAGGAAFLYIHQYYHAGDRAMSALENPPEGVFVEENDGDWITFSTTDAGQTGVIFYPGGKVQYESYAPLMEKVAEEGVFCVLVHMPGNLAMLDKDAAEEVRKAYPEIERWYIGGHSLGGVMAGDYVSGHTEEYDGVFFLASYPTKDLSDSGLKGLCLCGREDGVLNWDSLEKNKENLPENLVQDIVIEGGNHAQFGDYGPQKGDGEASISAEEQQRITAEAIGALVKAPEK